MKMLSLKGQLINIFITPKGEKNGSEYGGQDKLQIIGDVELPNGESRKDMFTLTTHDVSAFKEFVGQEISTPIGVFNTGKVIAYFIPKGSKPVPE
jgi:hypothetical protein